MSNLRAVAVARANGRCESCEVPLDINNFALHHRKLKSRGGKDEISNVIAVHHYCHNMGTNSIHMNPTEATRRGLMVNSWDNPEEIPIILDSGRTVLLTLDGDYQVTEDGNEW